MTHKRVDNGDETVLEIAGILDTNTVAEIEPVMREIEADRRTKVTVDLSGLDQIDSSGVAEIVRLMKQVKAHGGAVEVSGIRDQPRQIFRLLRLDKVFNL